MYCETNECCGCAVPGYTCIGDSCSLRHTRHYSCDICDAGVDGHRYNYLGDDLCEGCAIEIICEFHGILPVARSLEEICNDADRETVSEELKKMKVRDM